MKTPHTLEGEGVSRPQSYERNACNDKKFTCYDGTATAPLRSASLADTAHRIRTSSDLAARTARLRTLEGEARNREKLALPSVTFAGTFSYRSTDKLTEYGGLVVLDFDHLSQHGRQAAPLRDEIAGHPSCALAFVSPSGDGVKAVFSLDTEGLDKADLSAVYAFHKRAYEAVRADCEARYRVALDVTGKDVARLCFLCFDPDAAHNPDATAFSVPVSADVFAGGGQEPQTERPRTVGAETAKGRRSVFRFASPGERTRERETVERLCRWVAQTGADITDVYEAWYKTALALAREARTGSFPENFAREAFHVLSANHPAYSHGESERKFSDALRDVPKRPDGVTLGTVLHFAKAKGFEDARNAGGETVLSVERYASEALPRLCALLEPGGRTLFQANTGAGKTKATLELCRRLVESGVYERACIVVPFTRLAQQIEKEYGVPAVYGGVAGSDAANAASADVFASTYDGLYKLAPFGSRTLLVIDESHELTDAQGYRKRTLRLTNERADRVTATDGTVLYVTATPGDGFARLIGADTVRVVPQHVNRKRVAVRTGAGRERFAACLAQLAACLKNAPGAVFVLFCNSTKGLAIAGRYLAGAAELAPGAIATVKAGEDSDAVRALVETNRFPDGVRLVLATKALGAGYNVLNDNVGGIFYCANGNEGLRPGDAAQYTARFRNAADVPVFAFVGTPAPNGENAGKTAAELLKNELWKGETARTARLSVDLTPVDDCLPAVALGDDARALRRETDPNDGTTLRVDTYAAYFHACQRRASVRTLDDFRREWQAFDPGVEFVETIPGTPAPEQAKTGLRAIEEQYRNEQNEARECAARWDLRRALGAAYHAAPRLRQQLRTFDPRLREAETPSHEDADTFRKADGTKAAKRFLSHVNDGFAPADLWRLAVTEANPNRWQVLWRRTGAVLHLEQERGNLGGGELVDELKGFDFRVWRRHGLTTLTSHAKAAGADGVNMMAVFAIVQAACKRHGLTLTLTAFRALVPLHFDRGPVRRVSDEKGGRMRVRTLTPRGDEAVRKAYADMYGVNYAALIERVKTKRDEAKRRADANETAPAPAQTCPHPPARLAPDNGVENVPFANGPPNTDPCPY